MGLRIDKINGMDKTKGNSKESISHKFILFVFTWLFLFIEAAFTLIKSFNKGVVKKEVLSSETKLGFDVEIIMRK